MNFALTPEQEAFVDEARRFARERVAPAAARIDESGEYPRDLVTAAGALGLMGVTIPRALGGAGRDTVTYALAVEAVALASATLSVILTVNNFTCRRAARRVRLGRAEAAVALATGVRPVGRRVRALRGASRIRRA
jgi:alkylation response protein AidB-like acyl-CoA dehydrogenase